MLLNDPFLHHYLSTFWICVFIRIISFFNLSNKIINTDHFAHLALLWVIYLKSKFSLKYLGNQINSPLDMCNAFEIVFLPFAEMYLLIYRSKSLTPRWTCSMVTMKAIPWIRCIDDDHTLFIYKSQMYTNKVSWNFYVYSGAWPCLNESIFRDLSHFGNIGKLKIYWTSKKFDCFRWNSIIPLIHNDPSSTQSHLNVRLATTHLIFISFDLFEIDHNCRHRAVFK